MRIRAHARSLRIVVNFSSIEFHRLRKNQEIERTPLRSAAHLFVMPLGEIMNNYFRVFIGLGLTLMFSELVSADITSIYTELSAPPCTIIPVSGKPGDEWDGDGIRCKGPSGYELLAYYVDDRAAVSVISPGGARHDLDLLTDSFSSLGPRAEWRVEMMGSRTIPIALIVRVIRYHGDKTTSFLAVAKVTKEKICITDRISATGVENMQARKAADSSAEKNCQ